MQFPVFLPPSLAFECHNSPSAPFNAFDIIWQCRYFILCTLRLRLQRPMIARLLWFRFSASVTYLPTVSSLLIQLHRIWSIFTLENSEYRLDASWKHEHKSNPLTLPRYHFRHTRTHSLTSFSALFPPSPAV